MRHPAIVALASASLMVACAGRAGPGDTDPHEAKDRQVFTAIADQFIAALQVGDSATLLRLSEGPGIAQLWATDNPLNYSMYVPDAWHRGRKILSAVREGADSAHSTFEIPYRSKADFCYSGQDDRDHLTFYFIRREHEWKVLGIGMVFC